MTDGFKTSQKSAYAVELRSLWTALCMLSILFVLYGTLLPFRFAYGWHDLPARLHTITWQVTWHGLPQASLTDIVGNILLFWPVGFCLQTRLRSPHVRCPLAMTVLGSLLLSLVIEFTQLFSAVRIPAVLDVLTNTMGSFLGAMAAKLYAVAFSALVRRHGYNLLVRRPVLLIVMAFGLFPLLAALMPFTVSITPSAVMHNLKAVNLGLFTSRSLGALFLNATESPAAQPFDVMGFWEAVIFWSSGGYVLRFCYRLYWQRQRYGQFFLCGLPLGYFPLVEFLQIGITSRVSDLNDVLAGYVGVIVGMILYTLLRPLRYRTSRTVMDVLQIPLGLYVTFVLFSGLRPFDWAVSPDEVGQRLTTQQLIPLYAYFQNTSLWNMYDLTAAIMSCVPISLYRASRRRARGVGWRSLLATTTLEALFLGALIEGMQLFSLTRSADITDVLSYGLGGMIGGCALYYYAQLMLSRHTPPDV